MKRFGSFALAALLVAALGASVSADPATFKAASGTPTVDGVLDDAYLAAEAIPIEYAKVGDGEVNAKGNAYILWDNENLYVAFDVTDSTPSTAVAADIHNSDSTMFFFDFTGTTNDDFWSNPLIARYSAPAAIAGAETGTTAGSGAHHGDSTGSKAYASGKTDKGYVTEYQITWGPEFTPAADTEVHVAFYINDDQDDFEGREGRSASNDFSGAYWDNTHSFDKLVLTGEAFAADDTPAVDDTPAADDTPAPTPSVNESASTADMGIIAALAALASVGAALSLKKRK